MKYILIFLLLAGTAHADCRSENSTRDRKAVYTDWSGYQACIEREAKQKLENELIQSEIELNKAKTKWLRDDNRRRYHRQFPE